MQFWMFPRDVAALAALALTMSFTVSLPSPHAASLPSDGRVFLGHQVVMGTVPIAILGEFETRTDTWTLITATPHADGMRWQQRVCRVEMAPVAGVQTHLPQSTLKKLPEADIQMLRHADGSLHGSWNETWTEADLDGDGHPGVSIGVDVPLCRGQVYVAMQTHTQATAFWVGDTLLGELHVRMWQQRLGASNACLRMGAAEQRQELRGVFALTPAPGVTDCDGIDGAIWPIAMQNPRSL